MDLEEYEKLMGITIPDSKRTYYEAQIKRVQTKLETLLGYTLKASHIYTELGKSQVECVCPDIPETSSLLPPDEVKGIIKIFPYNSKDKFLHIDPFVDVYNVKLGKVTEDKKFITFKTFEFYTKHYINQGIGKYIEKCNTCFCDCECKDCVQLIVDADWVDFTDEESDIPDDLLYLWCDMVNYYADPTKDIKSESVDGHSWSKGDVKAPEESLENKLLLQKYAGPYGSITRIPTI